MAFDSNIKGYMTFGKSFSRGGAFPLEAYEIWTDYDALVAYAANTNPDKDPSYIGQKVAFVDKVNNKVTHYGIEIDGSLKELGATPIGDEKSIVVDETNYTISLKGVDGLVFERDIFGEDGEPTGEKEEVKFQPLMTKDGLVWVEPSKTTVEGLATLLSELTVRVKALEDNRVTEEELAAAVKVVADKVGVPAEGDESTATLYERIAAEVLRATQAEEALGARIGVAKDGETAATGVYAYVDGVVNALVNGVDPDKIDSLNELIAWVEAHPDIVSGLDERLGKVEGVLEGIGGEGEKATVKTYVDDALTAHEAAADAKYAVATDVERDYAKKATTLEGYGITDAYTKNEIDNKIGTPGVPAVKDAEGNTTTEAVPGTGIFASTYSKAELNALLDEIEGGSTESAASVARQLDEYKTTNNERVKSIEDKVGTDVNGEEPATGLFLEIDEARKVADEAKTASTKNTGDITALQGQLGTTNTNVSGLTARLAALEAEVGEVAESRIDALEGAVTQHTTDIGTNTAAITTLNTVTLPAIQQAIADGDKAINDKIGTVEEGKTVVDMINAVAGKIDFSPYAKKDEVAATYATIAALEAEAKRADEAEKQIASDLAAEIARADAAEKANAAEIARVNAVLVAAIENEDDTALNSIKELAVWIEEHETEVLPVIEQQGKDIAALTLRVAANETAVGTTLPAAIAAAEAAAKKYTDDTMVKADGTSIVNNEGTFSVGAVSTDKLVNGSIELVLNGGNATGKANA